MADQHPQKREKRARRRGKGEGSIFQSNGRWVVEISLPNGQRKAYYRKTQEEAIAKLHEVQLEKRQGTLATGPQQTLRDFLHYWLEHVHKFSIRQSTCVVHRGIITKHILPALGHIQLQKLTPEDVQLFYSRKMTEGYKASYIRMMHRILSKALRHAVRIKRMGYNVCDQTDRPRMNRPKRQALTIKQAQILLENVKGQWLEEIIVLALTTGMRRGEILALRWSDIDFETGILRVERTLTYINGEGYKEGDPKTESSKRSILLTDLAIETLKKLKVKQMKGRLAAKTWRNRGLVFCTEHGDYIAFHTLYRSFAKILQAAKLPNICFHELRHTTSTLLDELGVSDQTRASILGHASIEQTRDYTHPSTEKQREGIKRLDKSLRQDDQATS